MKDDSQIIEKVLKLLRQFGWETGYKKLEAELQAADDESSREVRELFLGWMAAERGAYKDALGHFQAASQVPSLAAWGVLGQAFVAQRQKDFGLASRLMHQANEQAEDDKVLRATIAHLRGTSFYHEGKPNDAYPLLLEALEGLGDDHFGTGRVLDTLGMIYADKNNFHAAQEFFSKAFQCKERHGDEAGLALTHGQLGRLYLGWELWDKAEQHFKEDLRISEQIEDERGQAQMYNYLAQVSMARADEEATTGSEAAARKHRDAAAGWLDTCIPLSQKGGWTILEAYARKDRALVDLSQGNLTEAENQAQQARDLFRGLKFEEGLAHVHRVWGILWCKRGKWDDALTELRAARKHFLDKRELVEVARTQFQIASVYRAAENPRPPVSRALLEALTQAELCRRSKLVRQIEQELKVVDPEAYHTHVYQRVWGGAVSEDNISLMSGRFEPATVLYLDLKGSVDYARDRDPGEVMLTLNQMMADLVTTLRKHDARVSGFRGDGFLALLRGENHALRAVRAALGLVQAIAEFNKPRTILKLPLFVVRIGIASGEMFLGNLGTYDKMDFTAIGTTANLGARLEAHAQVGLPCISKGTHDLVKARFVFNEGNPRTADLKGLGIQEMWDVVRER